jgi:hypothetical protein
MCGFQELCQRVELVFPEGAIVIDPTGCVFHALGREIAAVDAAVDFAAQQAGGFQHSQVFGDRRKRDVEWFGKFADGGLPLREAREDSAAGGIREGAEHAIESGTLRLRIFNHMV